MKAYLDIETSFEGSITVVGLYRPDRGLTQLVAPAVTRGNLEVALLGVDSLVTYNGSRFDLPIIGRQLGLPISHDFASHDLMYHCWQRGLYGGLKRVEEKLGIPRASRGIDGWEAMRLWWRYHRFHDEVSLATLLLYNREDVLNLLLLEGHLFGRQVTLPRPPVTVLR